MKAKYLTCCVNSTAEKINSMVEHKSNKEISYQVFIKNVDIDDVKELFSIYEWGRKKGLRLKNDWAVSFYKSIFDGKEAYYINHSAIEYIFI